ncbi:hypothetical protein PC129_g5764 [Phytophthora cactorum]|uniref:Uncharacterized protein n=1 Tax=Phytophthora cactorum TaxID=29920 RepID=A0A329SWV6_9STRA|nr:hypothetical protein Pcac1_g13633 [Phytophthora cactorum]KAG2842847.1 hypothetical protein PC111_g2568 [Phytophthora cactorum]KAG2846031.1 hypothetical protein PC112_g1618 [Phytophthora cactorum]KAG2867501.1 hypothetical protein PC113_g1916 [Phytophthora cactorum]KAG2931932.1 hypothetical protein PC114_g1984 [Phytophthora cactorum]
MDSTHSSATASAALTTATVADKTDDDVVVVTEEDAMDQELTRRQSPSLEDVQGFAAVESPGARDRYRVMLQPKTRRRETAMLVRRPFELQPQPILTAVAVAVEPATVAGEDTPGTPCTSAEGDDIDQELTRQQSEASARDDLPSLTAVDSAGVK